MVSAVVIGATGQIGRHVVTELLGDSRVDKVVVLVRKSGTSLSMIPPSDTPRLTIKEIPDFKSLLQEAEEGSSQLDTSITEAIQSCQVAFCTLGTTRAKAGSAEAFYRIDHDYSLAFAQICRKGGQTRQFSLVTSAGTGWNPDEDGDSGGSEFFQPLYTRTKNELDRDITKLAFNRLTILRPGLLLCQRDKVTDSRWAEGLVQSGFAPIAQFFLPDRLCVKVETVARAMVKDALENADKKEKRYIDNKEIASLGA